MYTERNRLFRIQTNPAQEMCSSLKVGLSAAHLKQKSVVESGWLQAIIIIIVCENLKNGVYL